MFSKSRRSLLMNGGNFLATLFVAPYANRGSDYANHVMEGFVLSGHMTNAGQESERYYAIAQGCALMLDPAKLPACVAGADALLNTDVEIALTRRKR
jgi:hypothetical protein